MSNKRKIRVDRNSCENIKHLCHYDGAKRLKQSHTNMPECLK
ncbi:MAG: hypothetical protein WCY14_06290 [Arcobacteraceae bacterium]